jgi:hypothetical protein
VNEQVLQERPGLLHVTEQLHDIVDAAEVLFPFLELGLEVSHEFRQKHSID